MALFQAIPYAQQGWVKYIRNALGMTTEQLAKRLGVTRRRVGMIEQAEVRRRHNFEITQTSAQAMNCNLLYVIIPKTSIRQTLEEQAKKFVLKHLKDVSHHIRS